MTDSSEKKVSVELTESQAQQVLRTVERDPDAGKWGDGNKTRNDVVSAFNAALGSSVSSSNEEVESTQEPAESEDDEAADGQVDDSEEGELEGEPVPPTDEVSSDEQPNTDESAEDDEGEQAVAGDPDAYRN